MIDLSSLDGSAHHRSVMIASEIRKRLARAGFKAKETQPDISK
jgi:hypothetical protein